MISNENKTEIIELYLSGALSGEALQEVLNKLEQDPAFRQEVELQRMIVASIPYAGRSVLKRKLKDFHKSIETENTPADNGSRNVSVNRSRAWLMPIGIAATITLTLLVAIIWRTSERSTDALLNAYFEPYPNVVHEIHRDISSLTEEQAAFLHYDNGDYEEAARQFETINARKQDATILFYLGNAYLSLEQYEKSISAFSQYLSNQTEFQMEAKWYLSLAYIGNDEENKAIPILEGLAVSKSDFSDKASKLLKELK